MSSKAHRRYAAGVERALGLFDTKNEWADYIAYLRSLHKALSARPDEDADIPFKSIIALHLAQCLRPSLPSGVHQKALETYAYIFSLIGVDGLAKDLSVYLPGISATLTFASLSIRPLFLSLIQEHVLRLPVKTLRPALKALILSLLPGLEEETSEDFDSVFTIFDSLRQSFERATSEGLFWQNLFLASITDEACRPGTLVYLIRCLPKFGSLQSEKSSGQNGQSATSKSSEVVLRPEPGLLIRCFATGLQDGQILVQRGFLDVLVTHLPLNATLFKTEVKPADCELLVTAALSVILRRDMSLNRRLWSWFLGPEAASEATQSSKSNGKVHVEEEPVNGDIQVAADDASAYGLPLLIRSFKGMLSATSALPQDRARTFRIARSLMDRWEIGGPVVAAIFAPLLRNLLNYREIATSQEDFDEVFRSANAFFDAVESRLIWSQIFQLVEARDWDLVDFILARFSFQEDEMLYLHIPLTALALTAIVEADCLVKPNSATSERACDVISVLISMTPSKPFEKTVSGDHELSLANALSDIRSYYSAPSNVVAAEPPLSGNVLGQTLLFGLAAIYLTWLEQSSITSMIFRLSPSLIMMIGRLSDNAILLDDLQFIQRILRFLERRVTVPHHILVSSVAIVTTMANVKGSIDQLLLAEVVPVLVDRLWLYLSIQTSQHHAETSQMIRELSRACENRVVESALASQMVDSRKGFDVSPTAINKFSVLWTQTKGAADSSREDALSFLNQPLLLLLDSKGDASKTWVQSQPTALPLLRVISADTNATKVVRLRRLHSMVRSMTSFHWQELQSHEAGHLVQIIDMCVQGISNTDQAGPESAECLSMLRLLYETNRVPILWNTESFVSILVRKLASAMAHENHDMLIDTLIAALGRRSPPRDILACLLRGLEISEAGSLRKWIQALCHVVPLHGDAVFEILMRVTEAFCGRVAGVFAEFKQLFAGSLSNSQHAVEAATASDALTSGDLGLDEALSDLLAGLEYLLARAREKLADREATLSSKDPDQTQGLFSSIVSSDRSNTEAKQLRSSVANDYLTLTLCFKDCIKACSLIWFWSSWETAIDSELRGSFRYYSAKMRNKTRRILEHLVEAEPQESLEMLIELWVDEIKASNGQISDLVLRLLQTVPGARPKIMIPTVAQAIQKRTSTSSLDRLQQPTASTGLSPPELAAFLIEYTKALEDDLLEEIWSVSLGLLREVLLNPMSHRQILVRMLEFIACLGRKMENTNFGEESKMRKELGDICLRTLTAIFTVKPEGKSSVIGGLSRRPTLHSTRPSRQLPSLRPGDFMQTLCQILPALNSILGDSERLITAYTGIMQQVVGPMLRSKNYQTVLTTELFQLLKSIVKVSGVSKLWRRELLDAFNDGKFLQSPPNFAKSGWFPLLQALSMSDKQLVSDLMLRTPAPTSTGLMLAVGATSARTETDKRTSMNLRRLALLILANEPDTLFGGLDQIHAKVEELLGATDLSSPSSATRADVFMLLRSSVLSFPSAYLTTFWPTIESELRRVFAAILQNDEQSAGAAAKLQAAKLLDLLLLLKPPGFQRHEWIFVTDTVDAIYPPASESSALIDQIARSHQQVTSAAVDSSRANTGRVPWLCSDLSRRYKESKDIETYLLGPFFSQLSIHAFEDVYSLEGVDREAAQDDLIADLFQT